MDIPWKPWEQSPNVWDCHIAQISGKHWLTFARRKNEPGPEQGKYVVRVHREKPTQKDMWAGVVPGATWVGDDVMLFHCIVLEFCKEYGDERCKDGRLWSAGAQT